MESYITILAIGITGFINKQNQDQNIGGANEEQQNTDGNNGNDGETSTEGQPKEQSTENQTTVTQEKTTQQEETTSQNVEMTEEERKIAEIKNTTTFIKPVEGPISSKYGYREPTTSTVPKNHTGIDIAANLGTKILSSTDGEVVVASSEGDYRKTLKN